MVESPAWRETRFKRLSRDRERSPEVLKVDPEKMIDNTDLVELEKSGFDRQFI